MLWFLDGGGPEKGPSNDWSNIPLESQVKINNNINIAKISHAESEHKSYHAHLRNTVLFHYDTSIAAYTRKRNLTCDANKGGKK